MPARVAAPPKHYIVAVVSPVRYETSEKVNFIEAKSNREARHLSGRRLLTPYLWPADRADLNT